MPSTWYSRTSPKWPTTRQPVPTTKCAPSGSARRRASSHLEGALESAVERPQLHGAVDRTADEARSARQHRHRIAVRAPSPPTLMVLSREPVMMRPSGAATTHFTLSACSKHTRRCAARASRNALHTLLTRLMSLTRQSRAARGSHGGCAVSSPGAAARRGGATVRLTRVDEPGAAEDVRGWGCNWHVRARSRSPALRRRAVAAVVTRARELTPPCGPRLDRHDTSAARYTTSTTSFYPDTERGSISSRFSL